ncbi:hypothetical protein [Paenibacillus aestuarii]|uniref:DUF3850 domain-containing protein n=1 Tax=Paenibacillus aestuarii TaxID=516965 RepID=A0ABW0KIC3_9BACL|nr:hypothetical protein [Paenibacillus aestuarii]
MGVSEFDSKDDVEVGDIVFLKSDRMRYHIRDIRLAHSPSNKVEMEYQLLCGNGGKIIDWLKRDSFDVFERGIEGDYTPR